VVQNPPARRRKTEKNKEIALVENLRDFTVSLLSLISIINGYFVLKIYKY
jgi:hypothetical protein